MPTVEDRRRSILLTAAAKHAGKYAVRELLKPGAYQVSCRITGSIDNQRIAEAIAFNRSLTVEPDSERASSVSADTDRIVCYLLSLLTAKQRDQVLRDLPGDWRKTLAALEAADVALAKTLLEQLRYEGDPKPVKGAVRLIGV